MTSFEQACELLQGFARQVRERGTTQRIQLWRVIYQVRHEGADLPDVAPALLPWDGYRDVLDLGRRILNLLEIAERDGHPVDDLERCVKEVLDPDDPYPSSEQTSP